VADNESSARRWAVWLALLVLLAALGAALILWGGDIYRFLSDQERVRDWVEGLGAWGPAAIFGLEMAQALVAPVPGQAIEAVSGYLYGPWWGLVFALAGIAAGSTLAFFLARRFGRPLVLRLAGQAATDRLDDLVRRGGAPFFFLIWLLPFAPDDLACLAAGLTAMPARRFLVLMFAGRLPGIAFSVWLGANALRFGLPAWAALLAAMALAALLVWRYGDRLQARLLSLAEEISHKIDPPHR
jgi:uncharacterized membrane protein YdjX (TVP38/TMEM64 family)